MGNEWKSGKIVGKPTKCGELRVEDVNVAASRLFVIQVDQRIFLGVARRWHA
jgi:hypothetical protein